MNTPRFSSVVAALPDVTPFVAPETLERRAGRRLVLRMGANESPFGPSPLALTAMEAAAKRGYLYNDPEGFDLRTEIASVHGVNLDQVVLGAGVDDLLMLVCRTYLDEGDDVVTSYGGYPTFNYAVAACGGVLKTVPYKDDRNDLSGLAELAQRYRPKLVYLANPDNPSGSWYSSREIVNFQRSLPEGTVLLLDEAYADFAPETPDFSPEDGNVIRMRTFSKAHGMAGLRVGYAIASSTIVKAIGKHCLHFGVNRVAQAGAIASLRHTERLRWVVDATAEARIRLGEIATSVGLRPLLSHTNFVAMDAETKVRAEAILKGLAERDVFIRKPGLPPLDRCIRVTVAGEADLERFGTLLKQVVAGI